MTHSRWSVVVPVKGTAAAKSRFGGDPETRSALALAMALDTVSAALAAEAVSDVIVVTSESVGAQFESLGASVVHDSGTSLNAAVLRGIAAAAQGRAANLALMLGDLPALAPQELDFALGLASVSPLTMVPDASSTGTTLLAALAGVSHIPAFGEGSAAAHSTSGYVALEIASGSGLRTDVDTLNDLDALLKAPGGSVGRHTRAVLDSLRPSIFV